jgi:hypothetical protein
MLKPLKRWLEIIIAIAAIFEWIADNIAASDCFDAT